MDNQLILNVFVFILKLFYNVSHKRILQNQLLSAIYYCYFRFLGSSVRCIFLYISLLQLFISHIFYLYFMYRSLRLQTLLLLLFLSTLAFSHIVLNGHHHGHGGHGHHGGGGNHGSQNTGYEVPTATPVVPYFEKTPLDDPPQTNATHHDQQASNDEDDEEDSSVKQQPINPEISFEAFGPTNQKFYITTPAAEVTPTGPTNIVINGYPLPVSHLQNTYDAQGRLYQADYSSPNTPKGQYYLPTQPQPVIEFWNLKRGNKP